MAKKTRKKKVAKKRTTKKKAKKRRTKKKTTRKANASRPKGATDWVTAYLKKYGDTEWASLQAKAKKEGVALKPINLRWGRAAAGLPPKTTRKAKRGRRKAATARRGPGKPRKSTPSGFRQEAADKLRAVASKAILQGDDKTASKLLEMIKQLG